MSEYADRFVAKTKKAASGCIVWTGAMHRNGYGKFQTHGKHTGTAHRIAFRLFVGPIPDGLCVTHRCDNRACVNPTHLVAATQKQNIRDMHEKGRHSTTRAIGEASGTSKLTAAQVAEIRSSKEPIRILADRLGVTYQTVWAIIKRKNWRHMP